MGSGPAVVHCSAGIGRTVSFVAVDVMMQRLEEMGTVDVPSTVAYLRTFRAGTVQTVEQYCFLYDAIVAYHLSNPQAGAIASRATAQAAGAYYSPPLAAAGGYYSLDDIMQSPNMENPEYLIHALDSMT
jgi:hypothetical protein